MLSRSADSLFWLNRYIERAEGLLRTLHTSYVLSLDKGPYVNDSWTTILDIFSGFSDDEKRHVETTSAVIVEHILLDVSNPNSLRNILTRARENARSMQDHLTKEVWEQVNFMYHRINSNSIDAQLTSGNEIAVIEGVLTNCLLYTGILESTMFRGMSWDFMNLGKYIERCLLSIDLMEKQITNNDLSEEKDILYWRHLLFSLSGYEFHLKNYRSQDANQNVVHQVLLNDLFPRSVLHCLHHIDTYLANIVQANDSSDPTSLLRQFGRIKSSVAFADIHTIRQQGVPNYLSRLRTDLYAFTASLGQTYFSYA